MSKEKILLRRVILDGCKYVEIPDVIAWSYFMWNKTYIGEVIKHAMHTIKINNITYVNDRMLGLYW